jgi:hypothetical protein
LFYQIGLDPETAVIYLEYSGPGLMIVSRSADMSFNTIAWGIAMGRRLMTDGRPGCGIPAYQDISMSWSFSCVVAAIGGILISVSAASLSSGGNGSASFSW